MMSLFNKRLDVKMAASLFVILGGIFFIFIFFLDHVLSSQIQQNVADQLAVNHAVMNRMILVMIICFAGVVVAMAGLFHLIIFKPLKRLSNGLESSIEGGERDLTVRLSLKREDEIGILADRFDQFISNLDEIIMNIGRKTETVAASASEVSVASEQMNTESRDLSTQSNSVAAAAEEMNSSMHTVAAASEEASTNITMVARSADQMHSNIIGVARNCDEAREISSHARKQVDTATEKVGRLGDAAIEISKVTHVITEIAEQTNLLALNATIEAARAGQAGKGFAVVADEIKHLASQTAQATETIREKIEGIQKSTADTVHEVGNISQVISRVDDIVNQITRAIEEQSATATEVAGNIEQASIGISEVNENVAQISLVASEIAKDIARVDSIASEMSGRADNMTLGAKDLDQLSLSLRQMISVFRVSMDQTNLKPDSGVTDKQIPELMPWRPEFQTHIEDVDTQHKELVRLINMLHRAMRLQKGVREVKGILDALAEYTVFHFGFEENLFKKFNYPEYESHKKIHKTLVEQVKAFQSDVARGKATVTMDLMDFLTDWLKTHILKTDMEYVPFLKEKIRKGNS